MAHLRFEKDVHIVFLTGMRSCLFPCRRGPSVGWGLPPTGSLPSPFNGMDTSKAVTRDDVLTYVKWRVDQEVQKLGADRLGTP